LPQSDLYVRFENTILEESEILRIRKNIMSLRANKLKDQNRSEILQHDLTFKKRVFAVQQSRVNISAGGNNSSGGGGGGGGSKYLNLSCNLSLTGGGGGGGTESSKKRGRKKLLFEGIKTELIDKAFLREFKSYLKKTKCLKTIYDELRPEEKTFWNEFMQANSPPFAFTLGTQRMEYKSFSKNLLRHIFSYQSVRYMYIQFIRERGKDIINSIVNKKIKKIDRKMMLFYTFYGTNLHRLYSNDTCDINMDDISETVLSTTSLSTFDLVNTSI
jgi:hypothetical protein